MNNPSKIWTDCLYCMICPRYPEELKPRSILYPFTSQYWKIHKWRTMMLSLEAHHFRLDILNCTYDLRYFIDFDRPEMCEVGALEWIIEHNGLKLWGTIMPHMCVCVCARSSFCSEPDYVKFKHQAINLSVFQFR